MGLIDDEDEMLEQYREEDGSDQRNFRPYENSQIFEESNCDQFISNFVKNRQQRSML